MDAIYGLFVDHRNGTGGVLGAKGEGCALIRISTPQMEGRLIRNGGGSYNGHVRKDFGALAGIIRESANGATGHNLQNMRTRNNEARNNICAYCGGNSGGYVGDD